MSFEVGDMVVCVDDSGLEFDGVQTNGIYTVRSVRTGISRTLLREVECIHLEGIYRPLSPSGVEWAFEARRFRKIRKPSIEIFRQIVASVKGDQNVNA